MVDISVIKDKGPSIVVVEETSGKKVALEKVEDKLEKLEQTPQKTSILDTVNTYVLFSLLVRLYSLPLPSRSRPLP